MQRRDFLLTAAWVALAPAVRAHDAAFGTYGRGRARVTVATGSPGELGLLEALALAFCEKHKATVHWHKACPEAALDQLRSREADVALVHWPLGEKMAVEAGWAGRRTLVAANEFTLIGPASDPAGVSGAAGIAAAFRRIHAADALFYTRADNAWCHRQELEVWREAGLSPHRNRYVRTGGCTATLLTDARREAGYFLIQRGAWLVQRRKNPGLRELVQDPRRLTNVFHALCRADAAPIVPAFFDFLASRQGQGVVRDFGRERYGESLFRDATHAARFAG